MLSAEAPRTRSQPGDAGCRKRTAPIRNTTAAIEFAWIVK